MKTNTIFYTLLIALISLTLFSCDNSDDLDLRENDYESFDNVDISTAPYESINVLDDSIVYTCDVEHDQNLDSLENKTVNSSNDSVLFSN
ncbi:hypothetical protein [Marinifilum flexuosum]|uniref:Secreted protein n=1 Tax=Marinifilum flexuosum TaxID=1117708 RepID=A0A419X6P1_9BACT|nr:hypothetical protein [Marinifilum flexuosum]RKE03418.1 hypothetical protein BXY64_0422 [Marinifilum flexuosum]